MGVRGMVCAQGVERAGDDGPGRGGGRSASVVWYHNPLQEEQRDWTSMAPELLCLILHKVQERRGEEGEGRRIVACAGVCRSWRRQVHHFCLTICHSPYIQFPSSLSQPGPTILAQPVQCVVRRKGGVITLYHGEHRQFMLAARRKWRPGGWSFAISSHPRCFSERGKAFMGKLKANFWASEFVLWDAGNEIKNKKRSDGKNLRSPLAGIYFSEDVIDGVRQRRIACMLIQPGQASSSSSDISSVPFALPRSQSLSWSSCQSVLPRSISKSIQTSLARASASRSSSFRVLSRSGSLSHPIAPVAPALVLPSSQAPTQRRVQFLTACFAPNLGLHNNGERGDVVMDGEAHYQMMLAAARGRKIAKFESLVTAAPDQDQAVRQGHANSNVVALSSKIPEWDPQQHCWSLDFKGRASLPSLHNFQLLVDNGLSGSAPAVTEDLRKDGAVVLQLGKIGKGLYTMDYAFPLTAVQAFAICISSFSTSVGLDP